MSIKTVSTLLFAAVLLAMLAVAPASAQAHTCPVDATFGQCFGEGSCVTYPDSNAFCACSSGSSGNDCSAPIDPALECPFNSVTNLATDNIPVAAQASFTNDELTIVIKSPLVTERGYSTIHVDDSASDNWNCTYPGQYWSRSFDGCLDQFTGVLPWAESQSSCGWVADNSDPDYFVYNADLVLTHHDFIEPFAGRPGSVPVERVTDHLIPLEVRFQKFVDVSTEIVVNAPVTVLAAITRQSVDPITKIAIIEVTTNLLWPYQLVSEQLVLTPPDYAYSYSVSDLSNPALCVNAPGETCTQVFRITMDASSGCEITGLYDLQFDVDCQLAGDGSLPVQCAVDPDAQATLNLSIISENFCAEVSVQVAISGSLTSFFDAAYAVPRSQFLLDQVSYFEADITSPDATLTSATINSVKLLDGATQIQLYAAGSALVPAAGFALDGSGSDYAKFYFTLDEAYLTGITELDPKSLTVLARVDVTFAGVPGVKRLVLAGSLNDKLLSVTSEVGVKAQPSQPLESGAAAVIGGVPALLLVLVLSVAIEFCF